MEPFYAGLGARVRQLRNARRLTQEELGQRLDPILTRASIAYIESGKQRILAHTFVQLATALNVTLEELLPRGQATPTSVERSVQTALARELGKARAIALTAMMNPKKTGNE